MPDPARDATHRPEGDPYKILQVDPEADPEVIQAAYRRLAQKYHPDVAPGAEAAARMIAINAAWETLGDPGRRAAHDRSRAAAAAAPAAAPAHERDAFAGDRRPEARGPDASTTSAAPRRPAPYGASATRPPDEVGRNWTSGRSTSGGGYDPATMGAADGLGAAGPPPGNPSGSVLSFGRYAGWSIGEIGRRDLEYLEWLDRMPIGRPYRDEIDTLLRRSGRRRAAVDDAAKRGLFRRR
jgi:curved DNA-binding protein CbpA